MKNKNSKVKHLVQSKEQIVNSDIDPVASGEFNAIIRQLADVTAKLEEEREIRSDWYIRIGAEYDQVKRQLVASQAELHDCRELLLKSIQKTKEMTLEKDKCLKALELWQGKPEPVKTWQRCKLSEAQQYRSRILCGSIGLEGSWDEWTDGTPKELAMNREYEYRTAEPLKAWQQLDPSIRAYLNRLSPTDPVNEKKVTV